jgi:hypothetical protein
MISRIDNSGILLTPDSKEISWRELPVVKFREKKARSDRPFTLKFLILDPG